MVCSNDVRGDKKKIRKRKRRRSKSGGIPPVIWHEIVEGHFGGYTFGGTCTQISWNELGKPSSCGIVNCRYFVVVSLILAVEWTILGINIIAIGITTSRVSFKREEDYWNGAIILLSTYRYRHVYGKSMRIVMRILWYDESPFPLISSRCLRILNYYQKQV